MKQKVDGIVGVKRSVMIQVCFLVYRIPIGKIHVEQEVNGIADVCCSVSVHITGNRVGKEVKCTAFFAYGKHFVSAQSGFCLCKGSAFLLMEGGDYGLKIICLHAAFVCHGNTVCGVVVKDVDVILGGIVV